MKISVKRTLTLLLAAAIYISALTGCSSPLASDQQGTTAIASGADTAGKAAEASVKDTAEADAAGSAAENADAANADATSAAPATDTESAPRYDGLPHFEKGMAKQMTAYSDPETPNAESEILRFCVYVETDLDTDGDGMADLVKVFVQVPKSAAQGKYKAAAVYDPTPYPAGVREKIDGNHPDPYTAAKFDLAKLNTIGKKRESAGRISSYEAAMSAAPSDWNYSVPGTSLPGYYMKTSYDYFLGLNHKTCGI